MPRKGQRTIPVSIVGDRDYINLLGAQAALRGMLIGELVRECIDKQIGAELDALKKHRKGE